jgi:hypothetical protein
MPFAMQYDVPADEATYAKVKRLIGDEPPNGLVAHLVVKVDRGLRHIGVWETEEDWQRFHDERSEPAVRQVLAEAGFTRMPPDPPVEVLELIDVSLGS